MCKRVLCSAGVNYFVVYPNGDVYRCMRDYNARRAPMFNASAVSKGSHRSQWPNRPFECRHILCNCWCDSDWATKWMIHSGKLTKKVPAKKWDWCSHKQLWNEQELDDNIITYMTMIWTPTLICNYTCPYCGCARQSNKVKKGFPSSSPELSTKQWLDFFSEVLKRFNFGLVQTNGGEPLLFEGTLHIIKLIAQKFAVNLVSNISVNVSQLVRAGIEPFEDVRGNGMRVIASLHPFTKGFSWDRFLGKLLMLQDYGYLGGVNFVGWPEQLFLYDYYKEMLDKYKIALWLQPWVGPDNYGFVGYTASQREYVDQFSKESRKLSNQLNLKSYVSKPYWNYKFEKIEVQNQDDKLLIMLSIKNDGSEVWNNFPDKIKLGIKLLEDFKGNTHPIQEFRKELPRMISPGESCNIDIEINLTDIAKGVYLIEVDMVCETMFWFSEQGCEPLFIRINKYKDAIIVDSIGY